MSQQHNGEKTFIATSAVTIFRRVKLTAGSGTAVEHAGADADFIGVAQNTAAIGEQVAVRMRGTHGTHKIEAAGGVTVGAVIYGAAAGKVDDAASGTAIGNALEAASGSGSIIECYLGNGAAGDIGPDDVVNDAADEGAVPILLHKVCAFDAVPTDIVLATAARKLKIVDYWLISRDTTAANVSVLNNGTLISTAVLAKGTANNAVVHAASVLAAQDEVTAGNDISVAISAQANVDVFLLCVPIA